MYTILTLLVLLPVIQAMREQDETGVMVKRYHHDRTTYWKNFNFVVAIDVKTQNGWRLQCTGSLLAPEKVLTSAQCFFSGTNNEPLIRASPDIVKVIAGEMYYDAQHSISCAVDSIHTHRNYTTRGADYDLAVLLLKEEVPVDGVRYGTVNVHKNFIPDHTRCEAAGWGVQENFSLSRKLLTGTFTILSRRDCAQHWNIRSVHLMCGFSVGQTLACLGDSGDPLIYKRELVGVIDANRINCTSMLPTLFIRVADFEEWVDSGYRSRATRRKWPIFELWTSIIITICVYILLL